MKIFKSNMLVMALIALVCGGLSLFLARSFLERQANAARPTPVAAQPAIPMRTMVVATQALTFSTELTRQHLREIPVPDAGTPPGAFATIAEVLGPGRRAVLSPFAPNEPIIAAKITGPGQRATLSALVEEGKRAVTIRVNDVAGVGGFVLPGDRVDVVLTRTDQREGPLADVILQGTRVLAVDQSADDRTDRPSVVKTVTVEVDVADAQRVTLASAAGQLSLVLRRAGETGTRETRQLGMQDVVGGPRPEAPASAQTPQPTSFPLSNILNRQPTTATVTVTRGTQRTDYTVPVEARR